MGPLISVGGVLLEGRELRPLAAAIDAVTDVFGIPPGEELKWSSKKGSWIYENLHDTRDECYRQVLPTASKHGARAIVVCWDTGRTKEKSEQAFERSLDFLFERLSMHLEDRDSRALIVAD